MSEEEIFDLLGIEEDNRGEMEDLIPQFKELAKKYGVESVWLKDDLGVSVIGRILDTTEDLVAVC